MQDKNQARNEAVDARGGEFTATDILFPRRRRLHPVLRIGLGIILNVVLALCVIPELGKTTSAAFALLAVALPTAAVTALVPVVCLGRDVARLFAIGLAILPGYVLVAAFAQIISVFRVVNG